MRLPLGKRIKKRRHLAVALLQDELIELLYSLDSHLVLHGGTAIWRCYGGNRFSEDLDFNGSLRKVDAGFAGKAEARSLNVSKYKKTENLLFAKVSNGQTEVRVEINFSSLGKRPIVAPFERVDGSFLDVLTLSPERLILEKMSAYANRFFVRDLYDIHHLSNYASDDELVEGKMASFLSGIRPPVDEANLKALVYAGVVPSYEQMVGALGRRWL
ncbi:nucleotidyl transferase AbiEii/AbiGii toxin family protein [Candidatus Micrarchaeota archaeon]|nr:nucleotidyl transferase AbiEii/AbiGii toxin family protein [Candidatus Micrarchaeota archaeon]